MKNDKREIKSIWWNGADGDVTQEATPEHRMFFVSEYHGDRDEEWVCVYDIAGKEIERHNVRYIASIVWG